MRALITGITGFVGGYLAEHLLAAGDEVLGAARGDRWPVGTPPHVAALPTVRWDVGSADGLDDAARRRIAEFAPECIYHLAAISVPAECGRDEPTPLAMAVNVEGTARVLALAAQLAPRPRVMFISTSHVYRPPSAEEPAVAETSPADPRNAYGKTKQAGEELVRVACERDGLDAIVVRAFQHAGPRQGTQMMLAQWAWQFAASPQGPIEVYNRDAWVDLTDVRDVVRAYRLLAEKGAAGETYNVGQGRRRRTGDVLDALRELAGRDRPIVELRPGVKYDPLSDTRKIAALVGWRPEIDVARTVADTWNYFRTLPGERGTQPGERGA